MTHAALETEGATGVANDTLETAQDLSNSLLVTGADRLVPLEFIHACTDGSASWFEFAFNKQTHGDGSSMPTAGSQPLKESCLRGIFV